jgi:hypothetical protein
MSLVYHVKRTGMVLSVNAKVIAMKVDVMIQVFVKSVPSVGMALYVKTNVP